MPVADFHLCVNSRMECLGVSQLHCRLWKCPARTRLSHTLLFLGLPSAFSLNLFQPCHCSLLAQLTPLPTMGDRRVDNQLTSALGCPLRAPNNSCSSLLLHSQLTQSAFSLFLELIFPVFLCHHLEFPPPSVTSTPQLLI